MKLTRSLVLALCAVASWTLTAAEPIPPQIQNLVAAQRPGSFMVDITYDLVDPDSSAVYIMVEATSTGGDPYLVPMRSLTGDVGPVPPGPNKAIVWNAWNDWAGNYTTNARVRLIADDSLSTIGTTNASNYTTNMPPSTNLVWIPSGAFNMGGTHVWLTKSIWMSKFEVSQGEYQLLMPTDPSHDIGGPDRPVRGVTWSEAVQYCDTLTARERAAGHIQSNWVYRLPTEAEWEYACRAGTTSLYSFGDDPFGTRLEFYAWYHDNSSGETHVVGSRAPNRWGLHDMHGNVQEWCLDTMGELPGGHVTDPQGPPSADNRAVRGGSWSSLASQCTSAYRGGSVVWWRRDGTIGFRVVLAPVQ